MKTHITITEGPLAIVEERDDRTLVYAGENTAEAKRQNEIAKAMVDGAAQDVIDARDHALVEIDVEGQARIDKAQEWAESANAPDGINARSAKSWAGEAEVSAAAAESFSGPTYTTVSAGLAATSNGQSFAVNVDGIVTIYRNEANVAAAQRTLATTSALASSDSGKGAALVTYRPALGTTFITRGVGDKLDDNRSVLDFLPTAQHSAIRSGYSTWDAAPLLNAGITDVGGKHIDLTAARRLSIGAPIDVLRGTILKSRNSIDDATGRATKIVLLDGADCAMIRTPLAAGGESTHYCGLDGLILDGNAQNNANIPGGAVQWYGQWIGSYLRYLFIRNTSGPGLVLGGGPDTPGTGTGLDVQLDHVWISKCLLEEGQYAFDTNLHFYGEKASARQGLSTIDHLFVENPKAAYDDDPRVNQSVRVRNAVRFHALQGLNVGKIHVEGALYGITISACQAVNIAQPSAAWCGRTDGWAGGVGGVDDSSSLFSIMDGNQSLQIGASESLTGTPETTATKAPLVCRAPYSSSHFPNMPANTSGTVGAGPYIATAPNAVPTTVSRLRTSNPVELWRESSSTTASVRMAYSIKGMGEYGFVKQNGTATVLGSNVNQSGAEKAFVTLNANGASSDSILMSDPVGIVARTTAAGINARYIGWVGPTAASQYLFANTPGNLTGAIPIITYNAGSPINTVTPIAGGARHLVYDNSGNALYCSTGTTSADWKKLTA